MLPSSELGSRGYRTRSTVTPQPMRSTRVSARSLGSNQLLKDDRKAPPSSPPVRHRFAFSPSPGPSPFLSSFGARYSVSDALPTVDISHASSPSVQGPGLLDMPSEIRNMIYEYAVVKDPYVAEPIPDIAFYPCWFTKAEEIKMMQQWLPPPLAYVSKSVGQEVLQVFYFTNTFDIYWDPEKPYLNRFLTGHRRHAKSEGVLMKFVRAMDFLKRHNLQIGTVKFLAPALHTEPPATFESLIDFVQALSPVCSTHPSNNSDPPIKDFEFAGKTRRTRRLFNFARGLNADTMQSRCLIKRKLWRYAARHPHFQTWLLEVLAQEQELLVAEECRRESLKTERRQVRQETGDERWGRVLRSRVTKMKEEAVRTGRERWSGSLRSRRT